MNMHHASDVPDWAALPRDKQTAWQRMAAATHGIVTPGNALSIAGFALVLAGVAVVASGDVGSGTALLAAGRIGDALDGMVAEHTHTKSPLGRAVDAVLDKLSALAALILFTADGVLPLWLALAVALQNAGNVAIGITGHSRRRTLQPSAAGKLSAAGFWIALVLFVTARLLAGNPHRIALAVAYAVAVGTLSTGIASTIGYALALHRAGRRGPVPQFNRFIILQNPISTSAHSMPGHIAELRTLQPAADIISLQTLPGGRAANASLLRGHSALLGKQTLLCVAAGDGTVNMVVDALLHEPSLPPAARQTPVLPLWGGNANDLAHMLNGRASRHTFRRVLRNGRVVAIRPLVCTLHSSDGSERAYTATCYASFGASAFAAQELERTMRGASPMRQPAVSRLGQEIVAVARALVRSPAFTISESGRRKIIYERIFLNGSRFAKVIGVPLRLTDGTFHCATIERKSLRALLLHIAGLARGRDGTRVITTYDTFTVLDDVWAQFDGEAVRVPAGTTVEVSFSPKPFRALSTRLG